MRRLPILAAALLLAGAACSSSGATITTVPPSTTGAPTTTTTVRTTTTTTAPPPTTTVPPPTTTVPPATTTTEPVDPASDLPSVRILDGAFRPAILNTGGGRAILLTNDDDEARLVTFEGDTTFEVTIEPGETVEVDLSAETSVVRGTLLVGNLRNILTVDVRAPDPLPPLDSLGVTVPEGYELVDAREDGFVIAIPDDWFVFDLSGEDAASLVEVLEGEVPDAILQQLPLLLEQGVRLFAVDGDSPNAFIAANLTVLSLPRFAVGDIDSVEEEVAATFGFLDNAELLGVERVDVAGAEALLIRYELDLLGTNVAGRQYWVFGLTQAFTITFTDIPEGGSEATFDEIIATFTPLP